MNSNDVISKLIDLINRAEVMLKNVEDCESGLTTWKHDIIIIIKRALNDKDSKAATIEKAMSYGGSINGHPSKADNYRRWLTQGIAIIKSWITEIEDFGLDRTTRQNNSNNTISNRTRSYNKLLQGVAYGILSAVIFAYYTCNTPWVWLFRQKNKGFILFGFCLIISLFITLLYDRQHRKLILGVLSFVIVFFTLLGFIVWASSLF